LLHISVLLTRFGIIALLITFATAVGPVFAGERDPDDYKGASPASHTEPAAKEGISTEIDTSIDYDVEIEGITDSSLLSLLHDSSQLEHLQDKPPASFTALERRLARDVSGFEKVLRSEGYYAAKVTSRIDREESPPVAKLFIASGPIFHLESYVITYLTPDGLQPPARMDPQTLGILPDMVARAEDIVAAQRKAVHLLARQGYPRAEIADQQAVVDHATKTMSVTLTVRSGPPARFGDLQFKGLEGVDEGYLRGLAQWPTGETFDRDRVEALRRKLSNTGLFESVKLIEAGAIAPDGTLPVVVSVAEQERRSIGAGVEYSSSEGAGTRFYWEHRNVFGQAERLRGDLTLAEVRQELAGSFIKPDIWELEQDLKANAAIKHEDSDAFEEESIRAFLGLERKWRDNWTVGAGTSFEYSIIDDQQSEETFALVGLPLTAGYDTSNNLLDPTSGVRLSTVVTPYFGVLEEPANFVRADINASSYYAALGEDRLVLAARGKLGSIIGEKTDDIPANKRFYAGGGGSIRGYEFRTVGPLNGENDPLGGRSVVEVGFEARIKLTEEIGIVPFIEGGNVFDSEVPDLGEELQWAAGLGVRYYTAVGPLRLDVAVPVNRRDSSIDDAFQFYISLGQAF